MVVADLRPVALPVWQARLSLHLAEARGRTVIRTRAHEGPLLVQRAFYPEADGTAHLYVLHPPGGVAGGDELDIAVALGPSARALVTTPAATKIYRTRAAEARLRQTLTVGRDAVLEWLPQETIAFGGARAESVTRVTLEAGARYVGWDIVCLGRPASGDDFASGRLGQRTELWREKKPLVIDRVSIEAGDAGRRGAWGWAGRTVYGCLLATDGSDELVTDIRQAVTPSREGDLFAVTRVGTVVVCRFLGSSSEQARRMFTEAWGLVRRHLLSKPACPPRIWAT